MESETPMVDTTILVVFFFSLRKIAWERGAKIKFYYYQIIHHDILLYKFIETCLNGFYYKSGGSFY